MLWRLQLLYYYFFWWVIMNSIIDLLIMNSDFMHSSWIVDTENTEASWQSNI